MTTESRGFRFGPAWLVTAAFIGPGTVVTASQAGAVWGCQLLWTIVFACLGAIVLQSLAARVGIASGNGLGEAIRESLDGSIWLRPAIALVIAAIGVGNTAYQTGNLTGAVTGIQSVVSGDVRWWLIGLAATACVLLWSGRHRLLHRALVAMVIVLSIAFLATALVSLPSLHRIASGMLIPRAPNGSLNLIIALIGTTIVPYNLFLHASGAARTWQTMDKGQAIRQSDRDTLLSVSLGGLVTVAISLTATVAFYDQQLPWTSVADTAQQLRPSLGRTSSTAFGIGLFAAGLTSSITAPLATAYAICGCLGWTASLRSWKFRAIATAVVLIGTTLALLFGKSPASVIVFAQVSNGLLLPVVALFLLWIVRRSGQIQSAQLSGTRYATAVVVVAGVSGLGIWRLMKPIVDWIGLSQ